MPREKLTKRVVETLKGPEPGQPGVKVRELLVWDRELRGFGVQVMPSGLKSFIIQYRNAEGRSRRLVIGRYGVITVEQAREVAREKLHAVWKGIDPASEQAKEAGAITAAEVADWYLTEAEAGRILGRRRRPIKASTLAMDRSRIEQHIKPLIGGRRVKALRLADIEGMQADIAAGKTAKPRTSSRGGATRGGEGVASRAVSTLHSMFEHAVRLGIVAENPARGVRKLAIAPRERRLSAGEIKQLGEAMREALSDGEHPVGLAAIEVLLLSGFRRQEALGLQRNWIDMDARCVRFPDTKSGAQVRPVGAAALDVVASLPVRQSSPYVFPADWGDGHFTAVARVLERVCSAARISGVTPHTLRHSFASVAADMGFSELTISALLGHGARGITQRYVHVDEAVRLAADRVSAKISELLRSS